ncbi:MAG: N-acetylgalactosamine-4-sulfatase [Rhodocyclaceae bacterium]|nr:MAG: N-acetylgalactosamine-4-sulfatase [Rhodocyclaceae bacterium]
MGKAMSRLITALNVLAAMLTLSSAWAAEQPNVIFVLADDLGYGDLGAHGHPRLKTPNLDRLGRESVRFTDFHVAPMCTPTRGELMTGISAFRNGATSVAQGGTTIRRELPLMPQFFKDNGYATAHFGKWHLGDHYPFRAHDRGFDLSLGYKGFGIDSTAGEWENDAFDDRYWRNGTLTEIKGYNTDVFFNEAMAWMRQQAKPFFIYLATTASHEPYYVESRYEKPYEDLGRPRSALFGMTANLDENVGRLTRFLEESGLGRNTIVIYMGDNGTGDRTLFYNAGMRGRKGSYYDGGHRVPFFIRWPEGLPGKPRDVDVLAHGTDVLPTLIDLCDLKSGRATAFDGHSLKPLLDGRADPEPERKAVIQFGYFGPVFKEWESTVLWKKWRLVSGQELYDVAADPGQKVDLAATRQDVLQTMRKYYEAWSAATRPLLGQRNFTVIGSPAQPVTLLTSADWLGPWAGDFKELGRTDVPLFGAWDIEAAATGNYEISLYLFPPDADTSLNQGLRNVPAWPVDGARLLVDERIYSVATPAGTTHGRFTIPLKQGERHRIEGRFLDAAGNPLSGAFFTRVTLGHQRRYPHDEGRSQ